MMSIEMDTTGPCWWNPSPSSPIKPKSLVSRSVAMTVPLWLMTENYGVFMFSRPRTRHYLFLTEALPSSYENVLFNRMNQNLLEIAGYFPGSIGKITTLHAVYYKEYWGLDQSFEAQVGREVSDFFTKFDERKDGLWTAVSGDELAGCIAITGIIDHPGDARLRWYIVDPLFQGRGIGRMLITKAIHFCRKVGYSRIYLWTFEGLNRAQSIYEQNGFKLTEEREMEQWGGVIREQRFDLILK